MNISMTTMHAVVVTLLTDVPKIFSEMVWARHNLHA